MTIQNGGRPVTSEAVYEDMCERIINLQLEPGQKISENKIGEEYGVSRSVIRTVFTRLNQRNLVEIYPQRGTYISKINLDYIADLLLLRTAIEKEALYEIFDNMDKAQRRELHNKLKENLEAQKEYSHSKDYANEFKKLDSQFHRLLINSVHRRNLMDMLEEYMIHIARWRNFDVNFDHRVPELIKQHEVIYEAIVNNDLRQALRAMSDHLETISSIYLRAKEQYPTYFTVDHGNSLRIRKELE